MAFRPRKDPNTVVHTIKALSGFRAASTVAVIGSGDATQSWQIDSGLVHGTFTVASWHKPDSTYRYTNTGNGEVSPDGVRWDCGVELVSSVSASPSPSEPMSSADTHRGRLQTKVKAKVRSSIKNSPFNYDSDADELPLNF